MTTQQKTKTDRDRFYEPVPERMEGIFAFFESNRHSDFVDGMKAFATEWFRNYSDETDLPRCWWQLVELANSDLYIECDELAYDDDEDDD